VPSPAEHAAGWFPDPNGRHEHRYFNGRAWTADVADAGQRAVDPLGSAPSPIPAGFPPGPPGSGQGNGIATAALVCGIIGVLLAWVPFVVVAGFVLAVLALVFGIQGIRRANVSQSGRGKALAGVILGTVGLALSVLGVLLSVVVFREVRAFMNPAAHSVEVTSCQVDGRVAHVAGTLTNRDREAAEFSLYIVVDTGGARPVQADTAHKIDPVAPGATVEWVATTFVDRAAETCTASADVFGPLPFGVDVERP